MDTFVEDTLDWAHIEESDSSDLAELQVAVEYFDDPITRISETAEGADKFNTICGRDPRSKNIVAYGWNRVDESHVQPKVVLTGAIHPAWRNQHIGTALAAWQIERAKEWALSLPGPPQQVWVGVYVDAKHPAAEHIFTKHGFKAERYFYDLHHVFARVPDPPPPAPVAGITFVPYGHRYSEDIRQLHNICFSGVAGFEPVTQSVWDSMQTRPEFRSDLSWLAFSADRLVGYALNSADQSDEDYNEGWTDRLGVHPEFRRRGIARGLLSWSMWSFGKAGMEGAGLGIDTADQAATFGFYQAIGYEATDTVILLSATIPTVVA